MMQMSASGDNLKPGVEWSVVEEIARYIPKFKAWVRVRFYLEEKCRCYQN
jgi:hypothetical protein